MKRYLLLPLCLLCIVFTTTSLAANITLRNNHPIRYTVKQGDTLWGVATKFLRKPWQWKQLWGKSRPKRIYAGDILILHNRNGQPRLSVVGGGTIKLSPRVRSTALQTPIPTIPLDEIRAFLTGTHVIEKNELKGCPYVVAFPQGRIVATTNNLFYARGICTPEARNYDVFRQGHAYKDPKTKKILGWQATEIGTARLDHMGDPAVMKTTSSRQAVRIGDRLVPVEDNVHRQYFYPSPPMHKVNGAIIAVIGGVTQIGSYQIVVLNLGHKEAIQPGDVLTVYQQQRKKEDKLAPSNSRTYYTPRMPVGELMVFRVFKRLSYALILRATQPIHTEDGVMNPTLG